MKLLKFGFAVALVVGISAASIVKILETPTTSCVNEVSELTMASGIIGAILLAPENVSQELISAISPQTKTLSGSPYITVAALSNDGTTMYVKVLLEKSATYTPEIEAEIVQIRGSMHKDELQCSMNGKKYDIYRAKTFVEPKKTAFPI